MKKEQYSIKEANKQKNKQTPWPLVRKRTIPTGRPPMKVIEKMKYRV
jgi:hypothetical protein